MATTESGGTNDVHPESPESDATVFHNGTGSNADGERDPAQHVNPSVMPHISLAVDDAHQHDYQPAAAADKNQVDERHPIKIEDANRWREAMGRRLCLLIHDAEGDVDIFKADCEAMAKVLQCDLHESTSASTALKVVSTKEFKCIYLEFILRAESTIFQKLVEQVVRNSHSSEDDDFELPLLVYYAYSGFRLIKAKSLLQKRQYGQVLVARNKVAHIDAVMDLCFENAFARWMLWADLIIFLGISVDQQLHVLKILMTLSGDSRRKFRKSLKYLVNSCDTGSRTISDHLMKLFDEQKRNLEKLHEKVSVKQDVINRLADLLFSESVYFTGFANSNPIRFTDHWKISSDYRVIHDNIRAVLIESSASEEKTILAMDFTGTMQWVINYLVKGKTSSDHWLWIHYSGHNMPSSNYTSSVPDENLEKIIPMCFEYFPSVVISLDCCFPEVLHGFSDDHVVGLFARPRKFTTYYNPKKELSCFTKELSFVLSGCDPRKCPFTNDSTVLCDKCLILKKNMMEYGFVFPRHVDHFFKVHNSERHIRYFCEEPLVSAPSTEQSTTQLCAL